MDEGLDTDQLKGALDVLLPSTRVKEWNVIAADELNKIKFKKFPIAYICNTQKGLPGLHWVSYFIEKKNRYEFFDSFGKDQDAYAEIQKPPGCLVSENRRVVQRSTTSNCGEFCVYFINCRANGMTMEEIQKTFVSLKVNVRHNDLMVRKFYNKIEKFEIARDSLRQTCCSRIKSGL